MSNERNDHDRENDRRPDQSGATQHSRDLRSREDDPRKRGQQDLRTTGDRDRPDDDPSRAPESGTP